MKYSFLLVNYNMAGVVERCVESIERQCAGTPDDYEIIIGDNSTDAGFRLPPDFAVRHRRASIITLAENRGWIDALNHISPAAAGEYVIIMHPDVDLRPECISAIADFCEAHPRAGIASPDLYYPDGRPNRIRVRFPTPASEARLLINSLARAVIKRNIITDECFWDRSADVDTDMVMSVVMVIRREVLRQVGAVDPRLKVYYGNDYICACARRLGWTCHYVKRAQAIHFERYTPTGLYSPDGDMAYKASPIPASARMRADFFVFISIFYRGPEAAALRMLAILQDCFELAVQFRHYSKRKENIRQLWRSVTVGLGKHLA